ncbi:YhgE/Pip domain-containing protein [Peribacillus kribbensis]|uniref:YhgE/Pip domain-containing protein n=1 Tax=Peribacillus kribbensis TaxID=356658 RepID=UPI00040B968B|nr:YhgE/Pip domain-containing protein [Peribacillus kribbensis]
MSALRSLKGEYLQIFKTRKLLIAVIAILFIPLIYSGAYLWAFWDPYGKVDQLPVAVVNQDKGADYNGKKLTVGQDLVKKLKDKKNFDWHFVSKEQADRGLQDQKYYMKLEIPEDFSKDAATLQSEDPKNLEMIYTPNEGSNYLTSKIGDSAVEKIKQEVSSAVTRTYAESMLKNIKDVSTGFKDASEGAGELHNGIDSAKNGAGSIQKGIHSAEEGAASLEDGIHTALIGSKNIKDGIASVETGSKSLEENLKKLAENSITFTSGIHSASQSARNLASGIDQFSGGFDRLKDGQTKLLQGAEKVQGGTKDLSGGAAQLSTSLSKWQEGAKQTQSGSERVSGGLSQAVTQVDAMIKAAGDPESKAQLTLLKEELQKLADGSQQVTGGLNGLTSSASQIKSGSDKLADGASQADSGQQSIVLGLSQYGEKLNEAKTAGQKLKDGSLNLASGLDSLEEGSNKLEAGADGLYQGSAKLARGAEKLSGGADQLVNGMDQLSTGSRTLLNGMDQLNGGSGSLVSGMDKLSSGAQELQGKLKDGAEETGKVKANNSVYDMFAKPVSIKEERLHHVPNYGTGFAPYFLPLSLFVGSLVTSVIFPMRKPALLPKSGFSWFAGKAGVVLVIGIFQALLADAVLLLALGLEVQSIPYFIMLSILTSWTFLAIVQFLVTALDNPGRFMAILVLVLQLISSAGTYPIELVPQVLQHIAKYLPMTYSVAGFRTIISTGDFDFMWHNITVLIIFLAAAMLATLSCFILKFKKGGLQEQMTE